MNRSRIVMLIVSLALSGSLPAVADPTSHALEVTNDGTILFVDLDRSRILKLSGHQLSVYSELEGVPEGDHLQNLVLTIGGELYLGEKKSIWQIDANGSTAAAKPPKELKILFAARPADLAPDGSVYVARDFRNINRYLPGGDAHPVLTTDNISKIHSLSVTPYGRVIFGNNTEVAKLNAEGEVNILVELEGQDVLGLAAISESEVLLLRRSRDGDVFLELIDAFGHTRQLLTPDQVASVSRDSVVTVDVEVTN